MIRDVVNLFAGGDPPREKLPKHTIKCPCGCLLYDSREPYRGAKIGCPSCKKTVVVAEGTKKKGEG